jgi:LEA14-like dessication related protein
MRLFRLAAPLVFPLLIAACSKPEPPQVTAEKVAVTAVSPAGLDLHVTLGVTNPNGKDLVARNVHAKVTLDGKYDVGSIDVPKSVTFPAKTKVPMDVPMAIPWQDVSGIVGLALTNRDIPYEVAGTVSLGGDLLNVDVPFAMKGTLTHDQLVQATMRGLPPGLFPSK